MTRPVRGLYEALITDALDANLRGAGPRAARQQLRVAKAADRIALHLAGIVERAVFALPDAERVESGIALARDLVALISERISESGVSGDAPVEPGSALEAIADILPDGSVARLPTPLIPLLDTALLTNAPGEPRVGSQLLAEIPSADRVDVLMAFIRLSGIAPMLPALTAHCGAGRGLRVLTTTFTGTTQASALDALLEVGAGTRLVRHEHDAAAREGLALPSRVGLLHRVHRVFEPYSNGTAHGVRVEPPRRRYAQRGRGRRDRCGVRELPGITIARALPRWATRTGSARASAASSRGAGGSAKPPVIPAPARQGGMQWRRDRNVVSRGGGC